MHLEGKGGMNMYNCTKGVKWNGEDNKEVVCGEINLLKTAHAGFT